jgi:photoactive yellow protein
VSDVTEISPPPPYSVAMTFSPFDLENAKTLTGGDLDALPFGVIVVDRSGTIVEYNSYEREMAHMGERVLIGLNFFRDVAPCTAIQDFEGRFDTFLDSADTSIEPFQFVFPFTRGAQAVSVIFVRLNGSSDRTTICVIRRETTPAASG